MSCTSRVESVISQKYIETSQGVKVGAHISDNTND